MSAPRRNKGIHAALISAFFLGLAPVFGKQAILMGLPPIAVVALRTLFATLLLFLVMLIFRRRFLYIYPAGLLGCLLAGWINGFGSLLYYSALGRIDAGLGQLLYSLYPLFVAFWLLLDRQPQSRLTAIRLALSLPAVYLLTATGLHKVDWLGVLMMLGAAAFYALHLPINQRVLYDVPAPTVTLYTLAAMSMAVVPVYLFSDALAWPQSEAMWMPLIGLTLVTFASRLLLFVGVKHVGGMQTALLGLSELLVTLSFAHFWLGERLSVGQWIGVALLSVSLVLVGFEKFSTVRRGPAGGFLGWLRPPQLPTDFTFPPRE